MIGWKHTRETTYVRSEENAAIWSERHMEDASDTD